MGTGRSQILDSRRRRKQLNSLMRRFRGQCWWCRIPVVRTPSGSDTSDDTRTATRDHLVPYSTVQSWRQDNIVLICLGCNRRRGRMSVENWITQLRSIGHDHDWSNPPLPDASGRQNGHTPKLSVRSSDRAGASNGFAISRNFRCDNTGQHEEG